MMALALLAELAAAAPAHVEAVIGYPPAFFAAQHPSNAAEMVARLPGFSLDRGSGVRGFEGAAGNVLIDGERPTSKNDNLNAILERIPAAKVERIDVIRGGAPGIDMQGKAVLANVILKKGASLRGQIMADASIVPDGRPLGSTELQVSGDDAGRSWNLAATYGKGFSALLGEGVGVDGDSGGAAPKHSRIDTEDDGFIQQITGAYELPLAGGTLKLNGLAYRGDLKLEEDDLYERDGLVVSTDQLTKDHSQELGVTYTRPLGGMRLDLVGLHQPNGTDLLSDYQAAATHQVFGLGQTTREDIARAVVRKTWSERLSGEVGAEGADNRLRSATRFVVDGADVPVPAANVRVEEERGELFAKATWRIAARWNLDGQLRYERSTISADGDVVLAKTLGYLKPRLLATWAPDAGRQVRLRVEREVGQLDFNAFVAQASLSSATGVTAGNPDLEPERAWVFEAALEQRFWGRGAITVTATHSEVQDVVDRGPVFQPGGGVYDRPANIGDGARDTIKAELTMPLEGLGLRGAQLKGYVMRRWSQVEDPTTKTERRISAQRPVEWEAKFSQDLPAEKVTWGVELYGGYQEVYYRYNAIDSYKLDPFLMTYVEWRPRPDLNVRAELENITRRGYRHTTTTWDGVRDAQRDGPAELSDRNFHFGRIVYLRLRKSFGG